MSDVPKFSATPGSQTYDALYEQDPRHLAVDAYASSHLIPATGESHTSLERIYHSSLAAGLPDIACSPLQAKFLMLQVRMSNATNVLEIGTLGGYSAAWMATAGKNVKVTTIEIDNHYASVATKQIADAGLHSQIEILQGSGLEILPTLLSQVRSSQRAPFDFVFIDANKQDNLAYFNYALDMIRSRAAIVVDNVVRNGKVASAIEANKDDRVLGTRLLLEAVGKDDRVDGTLIQTVGEKNYDGFMIAVKR